MLTITDLYGLSEKPLRGKISLKLLLDYYEAYLHPFKYCYKFPDGSVIDLRFEKKRLCHLLGIETIAKKRYTSYSQLKRYKGDHGYRRIENGEIDFDHLRNLSSSAYNSVKDKVLYFYQIPHIVLSPDAIFRFKKISSSNIVCEIMIYNLKHGVCAHLGIEKDDSGEFYYPRSFWVERNESLKFIQDQDDEILVDVIEQINLSDEKLVTSVNLIQLSSDSLSESQKTTH